MNIAPIPAETRRQLQVDAQDVLAAAKRHGDISPPVRELNIERYCALENFELGCWLYYYRSLVCLPGPEGLRHRIDCARRLFEAGYFNPEYKFYTVFRFGERQFDTIFEMGDSSAVLDGLRALVSSDGTGNLVKAFTCHGWPLKKVA